MKFSCGYPFPHSVKNFFHSFGYHILTAWKVTEDGSPFPYSVKKSFSHLEAILSLIATGKWLWISIPRLRKIYFLSSGCQISHCLHMKFSYGYPFPHSVKNFFHSFGYHILTAWKVTEDGSPFPYSVKISFSHLEAILSLIATGKWLWISIPRLRKKYFLSYGCHFPTVCKWNLVVDIHFLSQSRIFFYISLPYIHWLQVWLSCGYPFTNSVKKMFCHLVAISSLIENVT